MNIRTLKFSTLEFIIQIESRRTIGGIKTKMWTNYKSGHFGLNVFSLSAGNFNSYGNYPRKDLIKMLLGYIFFP